ncbi:MAG: hypothetical protein WC376_04125 [Candidatus Nanoarchaeia archaeon]|jgi:hypothetical protein
MKSNNIENLLKNNLSYKTYEISIVPNYCQECNNSFDNHKENYEELSDFYCSNCGAYYTIEKSNAENIKFAGVEKKLLNKIIKQYVNSLMYKENILKKYKLIDLEKEIIDYHNKIKILEGKSSELEKETLYWKGYTKLNKSYFKSEYKSLFKKSKKIKKQIKEVCKNVEKKQQLIYKFNEIKNLEKIVKENISAEAFELLNKKIFQKIKEKNIKKNQSVKNNTQSYKNYYGSGVVHV